MEPAWAFKLITSNECCLLKIIIVIALNAEKVVKSLIEFSSAGLQLSAPLKTCIRQRKFAGFVTPFSHVCNASQARQTRVKAACDPAPVFPGVGTVRAGPPPGLGGQVFPSFAGRALSSNKIADLRSLFPNEVAYKPGKP